MANKGQTFINNSIIRNPDLTPNEKALLNVLLSYNPCFPSVKQLVKLTAMGKTAVHDTKEGLRCQNVIVWKKGNSKGHNNLYRVLPEPQWKLIPIAQKRSRKNQTSPSCKPVTSPLTGTPNKTIDKNTNINNTNTTGAQNELKSPSWPKQSGSITGNQVESRTTHPLDRSEDQLRSRLREIRERVIEIENSYKHTPQTDTISDPSIYADKVDYRRLIREVREIRQQVRSSALNEKIDTFLSSRVLRHWL